ncbi:DUF4400 domain-containing protein [Vibrio sp. TBV020]|uniref:DUF4400 domain-containing protein n=1 Tax=Vibrio sp. TBV020 TaxID=3137398 RepID=UPI0038CD835F
MPEQHPRTQSVKKEEPTPWYGLPFVALGHLFWIWLLLIVIEWLAPFWGGVTGLNAQHLFLQQLENLHQEMPGSVDRLLAILASGMEYLVPILTIEFTGLFAFLTPYWHGVVYVTLSLFARIAILLFCYPLFLLVFFLGAFDGLVVRQRRVAFMDRETETKHFYSRKGLPWFVVGLSYAWLLLPGIWSISSFGLLLPGAILTGILVRTAFATYKKYL